jgi:hypothetical protein
MKANIRGLLAAVGIVVLAAVSYVTWHTIQSAHFTSDASEIRAIQQNMGIATLPAGLTAAHALAPGNGLYILMLQPTTGPLDVQVTVSAYPSSSPYVSSPHPLPNCTDTQTLEVGGSNPPVQMYRADCLPKGKPAYQMLRTQVAHNDVSYAVLATGTIRPALIASAVQLVRILEGRKQPQNRTANQHNGSASSVEQAGHQILVRDAKVLGCKSEHMASAKHTLVTSLDITNMSNNNLAVDWLNYHGRPERMATVFVGATWHTSTNAANAWRFSFNGQCTSVILTSTHPGTAQVN